MDLERVWALREDEIYPDLFGTPSRGVFPLTPDIFRSLDRQDPDPRWLTYGVFEYGPTPARTSWLYVTSGYSNPWETEPEDYDVNAPSGAGVEFTLEASAPGDWAIKLLQHMLAFDMLLCVGHFGHREPLSVGDRIPFGGPINGDDGCVLKNLLLMEPEHFGRRFQLPSGTVKLLQFVGITDEERDLATQRGFDALLAMLRKAEAAPVIDPRRASCV